MFDNIKYSILHLCSKLETNILKIVRIIKNWESPNLLRQTPGSLGIWDGIKFTLDPVDECDYVVVLNYVPEDVEILCPAENVWVVHQEPPLQGIHDWIVNKNDAYNKIFTHYIFNKDEKRIETQTCLPWHINKTYDELVNIPVPQKTKIISWITSNKSFIPGHKSRMRFYDSIKEDKQVDIDFFGFGIHEIEDKWDGLYEYKYSLAVENYVGENYWTEKVADCFLAYALPIYYGCTNLEKYFPPDSFVRIDINDKKQSIKILNEILKNNEWEKRIEAVTEARELVLNKYQLFPYIAHQIKNDKNPKNKKKKIMIKKPK
jgi:hypothetical protein